MSKTVKSSSVRRQPAEAGLVSVYNDNISIIESLVMTRAQRGGNVYRKRFLLRLMALAQNQIRANMSVVLGSSKVFFKDDEVPILEIPVRDLIDDYNDTHIGRARAAIVHFSSWYLYYENDREIIGRPVLLMSRYDKLREVFVFRLEPEVWRGMFDFSHGYSVYNLAVALTLENELAMKLFKGLEKQNGSIYYTFDSFRKSFDFTKRFVGRNHDLVRDMVKPAKNELDMKSPMSFDYQLDYSYPKGNNRGRKSLVGITIKPVRRLMNDRYGGVKDEIHPSDVIGMEAWRILSQKLEFTVAQVRSNLDLFRLANVILGQTAFADWLDSVVPDAVRAEKSVQGYVVNALKRYLERKAASASPENEPAREPEPRSVLPVVKPEVAKKGKPKDEPFIIGDLFSPLSLDF